jgi:glycolate oxidase
MPDMFSPTDLATMGWVRQAFDPEMLANPTKLLPSPRTCGEAAQATASNAFPEVERY